MTHAVTTKKPSEAIVELTDTALEKLKALATKEDTAAGIRVGVVGGGCAGLQYQMDPCQEINPEDITQTVQGVVFYFHPMVVPYLKGMTIDYSTALVDGGFKFINPNASNTCGCGTSFGI